jgi:hypothetical protein
LIFFFFIPEAAPQITSGHDFVAGHPQQGIYGLQKRKVPHIPVLTGTPIPRRDLDEHANRYAIVMLALFRPWNRSFAHPLKAETESWKNALADMLTSLSPDKLKIIDHMQEQWECRLAADDFSAQYRSQLVQFDAAKGTVTTTENGNEFANDLDWQLGQLDAAIGPEYNLNTYDLDDSESISGEFKETCSSRTKLATEQAISMAAAANFYYIPTPPENIRDLLTGHVVESTDGVAQAQALQSVLSIAGERAAVLSCRDQGWFLMHSHIPYLMLSVISTFCYQRCKPRPQFSFSTTFSHKSKSDNLYRRKGASTPTYLQLSWKLRHMG